MIVERFEQQVKANPGKLAVKSVNESLSYTQLNDLSVKIAAHLSALPQLDSVKRQRQIGLLLDEPADMIAAILGTLRAGNVYVPLVNDFPVKRLRFIAQHAGIWAVITDRQNVDLVSAALPENTDVWIILIEKIKTSDTDQAFTAGLQGSQRKPLTDSGASLLYTSGSTGSPKGVLQTHRNICFFIDRYTENIGVESNDKLTLLASFSHDVTLLDMYASLLSGATLFPLDLKEDGVFEALPQWLKQEEITVWHSVPTVFRYFTASLTNPLPLPNLKRIVLGGEASGPGDIETFNRLFRHCIRCQLYLLYGQTESSYNSGKYYKIGDPVGTITLGEVNKGTELYVVDSQGDEVEPLETGEILVVNPHLSPGYWKDPERTKERFVQDPDAGRIYFSGDYGRKLPDGQIQFTGRKDNQVKIRGYRIELEEIEKVVMEFSLVVEAVVNPIELTGHEKFLACYFQAVRDFELKYLKTFLEERLPDYMIPSYFKQLRHLPVTISGKIDRHALPAPEVSPDAEYVAPGTSLEKQLVNIWSDVLQLGKEVIGIDSNFFQMGGHSLRATSLTARIHRDMKIKVPLAQVFELQTIRLLAQYIEQTNDYQTLLTSPQTGIVPVEKKEYYPVSVGQELIYEFQQAHPSNTYFNMPLVFTMDVVDMDAFNEVFRQVIRRQEVLRTGFEIIGGQLVQRVYEPEEVEFEAQKIDTTEEKVLETFHQFIKPFDLTAPPLLRVGVTDIGSPQMVIFDFHHIVSDNITLNLLEKDCMAYSSGNPQDLHFLNVQYKDYAVWEHSPAHQEALKEHEKYWLKTLEAPLPVLNFPYDRPRPAERHYEGGMYSFLLGKELTRKIKTFAAETDTTFFNLAFAAFNIMLAKICGQEEIILGTPTAVRHLPELQEMIGLLINTLPQRNYPRMDKTLEQFLDEIKQNALEAYEHKEYPYETLCEKMGLLDDKSRNPLFDMMFNVVDERLYQGDTDRLGVIDQLINMRDFIWVDLALVAVDRGDNVLMKYKYSSYLFKGETLEKLARIYKQVLSFIPDNPGAQIKDVEMDPIS